MAVSGAPGSGLEAAVCVRLLAASDGPTLRDYRVAHHKRSKRGRAAASGNVRRGAKSSGAGSARYPGDAKRTLRLPTAGGNRRGFSSGREAGGACRA